MSRAQTSALSTRRRAVPWIAAAAIAGLLPGSLGCAYGPSSAGALELGPRLELLVDPGGTLTIDDVASPALAGRFSPSRERRPNLGYSSAPVWARFELDPLTRERWLLEVGFSQLDHVTLYVRQDDGSFDVHATGDLHPFRSRDIRYPTFVFELDTDRRRPIEGYLRVQSSGSVVLPVIAWPQRAFLEHASETQLGHGLYYAFLLALAAYNLFLFFAARDRAYLWYVLYLLAFVLFQAAFEGHAAMYLWPDSPAWASAAAGSAVVVSLAAALLFVRRIVDLERWLPRIHRALGMAALGMLIALPALWLAYAPTIRAVAVGAGLATALLPIPIALAMRRGSRPARYVLLAYAAILPGAIMFALRQFEFVPAGFLSENLLKIGTAVEAVLLSFALADRIDRLTREKADAQDRLLDAERAALVAQRDLSLRLIAAQDEERQRVASELHDGLGQSLLVLVNDLGRRAHVDPGLSPLAVSAADAVRDVRRLSQRLHPGRLDRLGLSAAVRTMAVDALVAAGIEHEVIVEELDHVLTAAAQLHVYRIAQELLSNVVKHSSATEAVVTLRRDGDHVVLEVQDDGVGLGPAAPLGLGLAGIEERVRLLGGRLSIGGGLGDRGVGSRVEVPSGAAGADRR